MRRSRIIAVLAAAATIAAIAIPAAALAQVTGTYCAGAGSGLCLSSAGAIGNVVYTKTGASGSREQWFDGIDQSAGCGGGVGQLVTATCPFTAGSGMRGKYIGDTIYLITNDVDCAVGISNGIGADVQYNTCAAGGKEWIDTRNANNGQTMLNVSQSDSAGTSEWLYSDGTNGDGAEIMTTHSSWN